MGRNEEVVFIPAGGGGDALPLPAFAVAAAATGFSLLWPAGQCHYRERIGIVRRDFG